ncbi:Lysine transporter LysE [Candidatus Magnetomoraceae bacterium gMMP-15]
MLTFFTIFFSSFIIALSGALMPGPLLTATISESSRQGFIAGPLLILGHAILELVLVIALLFGLAPFLQQDNVFIIISMAGGGILLWMAGGMFRSLPTLSLSIDAKAQKSGHLIMSGILLSLANPYWAIWWATIGLGYILNCMEFGMLGVLFFFSGHILADLAWYALVSAAVGKGRHFLSDRIYRGVIGTCAGFLVVFACYFVYAGINKIVT